MAFQQIKTPKGSEIVLQQIKQQIAAGVYAPGTKLPTVVDLAASFAVGRSTVREALSALKAMGWVTIRHGGGTFVSTVLPPAAEDTGDLFQSAKLLQEVLEVRKFIEAGCAALAAARRTEEDLAELKHTLQRMDEALGDETASEEADLQFHLAIARAAHNTLFLSMMESLTDRLKESMRESRQLWFFAERASAEQLLLEHQEILAAIAAQDAELAVARMMNHLMKVEQVIGGLNAPAGG
ncbi:FadR/GntR family transcriptional regulator [Paenibacillus sp. GCM10023252]|uniref:FadR/GntR family transcriptional regulator n=1 Tax=Paenibacillus sp. GCM10023252 TaxID=3252649 RepID=UPI003621A110